MDGLYGDRLVRQAAHMSGRTQMLRGEMLMAAEGGARILNKEETDEYLASAMGHYLFAVLRPSYADR